MKGDANSCVTSTFQRENRRMRGFVVSHGPSVFPIRPRSQGQSQGQTQKRNMLELKQRRNRLAKLSRALSPPQHNPPTNSKGGGPCSLGLAILNGRSLIGCRARRPASPVDDCRRSYRTSSPTRSVSRGRLRCACFLLPGFFSRPLVQYLVHDARFPCLVCCQVLIPLHHVVDGAEIVLLVAK